MSKGLEIINFYEDSNYLNTFHPNFMKDLQIVKKDLQRLEAIDNANPSEALKGLERIKFHLLERLKNEDNTEDFIKEYEKVFFEPIKQSLLKAQEQEEMIVELCEYYGLDNLYPYDDLEEIEYALKNARDISSQQRIELLGKLNKQEKENAEYKRVLEIIKNKCVDIQLLKRSENWLDYYTRFKHRTGKNTEITQEEFDLLKRYLNGN